MLELSKLADSVEKVGVSLFAQEKVKFPVTIGKLGGKSYLGQYWQWRTVNVEQGTLFSWPVPSSSTIEV